MVDRYLIVAQDDNGQKRVWEHEEQIWLSCDIEHRKSFYFNKQEAMNGLSDACVTLKICGIERETVKVQKVEINKRKTPPL